MAKPIKSLELRYPMIQFSIIMFSFKAQKHEDSGNNRWHLSRWCTSDQTSYRLWLMKKPGLASRNTALKKLLIPRCFGSCPNFTSKTRACVLLLDSSVAWFLFLFSLFQTLPVILKMICAAGLSLNRTTLTGNANKEELLLLLQVHLVDKEIPVRLRQSIVRHR